MQTTSVCVVMCDKEISPVDRRPVTLGVMLLAGEDVSEQGSLE